LSLDGPRRLRLPDARDREAKAQALHLWQQDRAALLPRQPFLARLALQLELVPVVDDRLETAATDGSRIFVKAPWLLGLDAEERTFVLAHEVWHCALGHFVRGVPGDLDGWNVAFDHEVNALLRRDGIALPEDAVYFPPCEGWTAEAVYAVLKDASLLPERGHLADQHPNQPDEATGEESTFDPDYAPGQLRDAAARGPVRIAAAARGLIEAGVSLPPHVRAIVERSACPTLPWTTLLASFVSQAVGGGASWLPPSRRHVWRGHHLPSRRQPRLEICVAIDTSGSTKPYLPAFLTELSGIAGSFGDFRLRVLQCDCRVIGDDTYSAAAPPDPEGFELSGFGGTSFLPVFERLAQGEAPRALVYLTDGWGEAPEKPAPYPVLWVLTPEGDPPCAWGQVARMPREAIIRGGTAVLRDPRGSR